MRGGLLEGGEEIGPFVKFSSFKSVGTRTRNRSFIFEHEVSIDSLSKTSSCFVSFGWAVVPVRTGYVLVSFEGFDQERAKGDFISPRGYRGCVFVLFPIKITRKLVASGGRRWIFAGERGFAAEAEAGGSFCLSGGQVIKGLCEAELAADYTLCCLMNLDYLGKQCVCLVLELLSGWAM